MDLNPIEHAWDILQRKISARPVQPRTLQELKDALVTEWRLILQNLITTLITSMRRRSCAVMDAPGHHTHFKACFKQRIKNNVKIQSARITCVTSNLWGA